MTNFEASRVLEMSLDVRCSNECYVKKYDECDDCIISEAFCLAIETLEKADIYGWHDLRKDPSDVPKHCKRVFCLTNKTDEHFKYCIVSKGCDYWNKYVIAWKELEPLEDKA